MSRGASGSALTKRLAKKLGVSVREAGRLKQAFVEALKEEVEARYHRSGHVPVSGDPNAGVPLTIIGFGSFKMRTRPTRGFPHPPSGRTAVSGAAPYTMKPPSRRLVFTSKWEPLP